MVVARLPHRHQIGEDPRLQRVDEGEGSPVQGEGDEDDREEGGAAAQGGHPQRGAGQQQLGGGASPDVGAQEPARSHRLYLTPNPVVAPEPQHQGGGGGHHHRPGQRPGGDDHGEDGHARQQPEDALERQHPPDVGEAPAARQHSLGGEEDRVAEDEEGHHGDVDRVAGEDAGVECQGHVAGPAPDPQHRHPDDDAPVLGDGPPPARLPGHVLLQGNQEDGGDDEERRPQGGDGGEGDVAQRPGPHRLEHVGQDRPRQAPGHHRRGAGSAQAPGGVDGHGLRHRAPARVITVQTLFHRIWRSRAGDMCWM